MMTARHALLCGTAAFVLATVPALAEDDVAKRLDRMQAMIDAQQKQIAEQRAEIDKLRTKAAPKLKKAAKPEQAAESEPAAKKTTAAFSGWEDAPRAIAIPAAAETPAPKLDTKAPPAEPPP